jgi:hypothetical protein
MIDQFTTAGPLGQTEALLFCGVSRSTRWPLCRAEHLRLHPACAICGVKVYVDVHHKIPVHVNRDGELDPGNLITLCDERASRHHFEVGHGGDWRLWNEAVDADAEYLSAMYRRIRGMRLKAGDVADAPSDSRLLRDMAIAAWLGSGVLLA